MLYNQTAGAQGFLSKAFSVLTNYHPKESLSVLFSEARSDIFALQMLSPDDIKYEINKNKLATERLQDFNKERRDNFTHNGSEIILNSKLETANNLFNLLGSVEKHTHDEFAHQTLTNQATFRKYDIPEPQNICLQKMAKKAPQQEIKECLSAAFK